MRRNACLIHIDINKTGSHVHGDFSYAVYSQQLLINFRRSERTCHTADVQDDAISRGFRQVVGAGRLRRRACIGGRGRLALTADQCESQHITTKHYSIHVEFSLR